LADSIVIATARQSESAPKASVAATASINLGDATAPLRPLKPAAPCKRVMIEDPKCVTRITRDGKNLAIIAGDIAATFSRFRRKR